MSPQIVRNQAARAMFDWLSQRSTQIEKGQLPPPIDKGELRARIDAIVVEELKHVRTDLLSEARRNRHFHATPAGDIADELVTVRSMLEKLDRRIQGDQT